MAKVTIRYLEMTSRDQVRPPNRPAPELKFIRAEVPLPEFNRFFYVTVGRQWLWIDRLSWSRERWSLWVDRPELQTFVAYVRGTPAGYFELERQAEGNVEVAYLGLIPQFIGQGVGGHLVAEAATQGWNTGARRVWLHTCTLDHPQAMTNYLARGFKEFKMETIEKELPDPAARRWPE
jgi:GNAT superfamily N-acetyltransferase